ncbi:hypothetical protein [Nonomuraea turkmeniaca]|nr:hypothetical protein [Nonomuraea turkmeniaca]
MPQSGILEIQAWSWHRPSRTDGTVRIEVLNHNKPAAQATHPVHCQH